MTGVSDVDDVSGLGTVDLDISGMTCASCANRIERKLNKVPGVRASVNYATERATVDLGGSADVAVADVVAVVEAAGYGARVPEPTPTGAGERADGADGAERRRLIGAAALSVPVLLQAMVPGLDGDAWRWAALVLATIVVGWGGWPFHRAAAINLRHGAATMDTLVSLGTLAAWAWSAVVLVGGLDAHLYLETAAVVTVFVLAGRAAEARAKRRAGSALRALVELGARDAAVLRDGLEVRVPIGELAVGDEFVVRPGERVAADGVVVRGTSALDTSLLTGEPVPVEVGEGDDVVGGTVNAGGRLVVRATRVGADTQLAHLARLVADAQAGKADVQRLADRVSAVFVPTVVALAALTLVGWLVFGGGATAAFTAAVAVLIIACPCALGLATPTALMVGTGRGAQLGILITGPEVLERTRTVDTVLLDKTGTVTTGVMTLADPAADVVVADGVDRADLLRRAGAVEDASEHPVARAIAQAARAADVAGVLPAVEAFEALPGLGARGEVDGVEVLVGRLDLLADRGLTVPASLSGTVVGPDRTEVAVGWEGEVRGVIGVADEVKSTSAEAVRRLRDLGLRPVLLTGDRAEVAQVVARAVGIDAADVVAGVRPEGKADVVRRLQAEGHVVAMVGDGVNDAPALALADLGVALGTGTDVAAAAADLTLMRGDLRAAADAVALSRRVLRTIRGNLGWAFGYNVAAIPLAAAGLLSPMVAGAAMAFSSVFVIGNSLRLRRFRAS